MSVGMVLLCATMIGHFCFAKGVVDEYRKMSPKASHWIDVAYIIQSGVAMALVTLLMG